MTSTGTAVWDPARPGLSPVFWPNKEVHPFADPPELRAVLRNG